MRYVAFSSDYTVEKFYFINGDYESKTRYKCSNPDCNNSNCNTKKIGIYKKF